FSSEHVGTNHQFKTCTVTKNTWEELLEVVEPDFSAEPTSFLCSACFLDLRDQFRAEIGTAERQTKRGYAHHEKEEEAHGRRTMFSRPGSWRPAVESWNGRALPVSKARATMSSDR